MFWPLKSSSFNKFRYSNNKNLSLTIKIFYIYLKQDFFTNIKRKYSKNRSIVHARSIRKNLEYLPIGLNSMSIEIGNFQIAFGDYYFL